MDLLLAFLIAGDIVLGLALFGLNRRLQTLEVKNACLRAAHRRLRQEFDDMPVAKPVERPWCEEGDEWKQSE